MQAFYQWTPTTAMTTYLLTCTHDCLTALCPGHLPTQLISEKLTEAGSGPEKCPKVSERTGLHDGEIGGWLVMRRMSAFLTKSCRQMSTILCRHHWSTATIRCIYTLFRSIQHYREYEDLVQMKIGLVHYL